MLDVPASSKAAPKASSKPARSEAAPRAPKAETTVAPVSQATGIAVRKGVPMPSRQNGGGGKAKYPWTDMEVGDSFFIAGGKLNTFYTLTADARKRYGKNFRCAKLVEEGVEGVGVWCLAPAEDAN